MITSTYCVHNREQALCANTAERLRVLEEEHDIVDKPAAARSLPQALNAAAAMRLPMPVGTGGDKADGVYICLSGATPTAARPKRFGFRDMLPSRKQCHKPVIK